MGIFMNGLAIQTVVLTSSTDTKSMAENLKIASLNTLVGLTVVFAVLTIMIFFISLFKIFPYLQSKKAAEGTSVDNVIAKIVEQEEEELVSDCELVAVITAAIYASLGDEVPADGLIVRSIRRAGSKNWMKA